MNSKLNLPVGVALFAALAVGLMFLLSGGLLQAQDNGPIMYAENDMDAVATFTGSDPEDRIVYWSLATEAVTEADVTDGDTADDQRFMISSDGVLTFKFSPDYEMPRGLPLDTNGNTNTYKVVVVASDDAPDADADAMIKMAYEKVTIEVTDVDEDGSISLSAVQPQESSPLTAALTDDDATDARVMAAEWKWEHSSAANGPWTPILTATTGMYSPLGVVDKYLRVTATYIDEHGSDKTAQAVSANMVRAAPANNAAPVFPAGSDGRSVDENSPPGTIVGEPVVAIDVPGDKLTYTLGGDDANLFDINPVTGQITVGARTTLDNETDATASVTVTATDPAGAAAIPTGATTETVAITINDVNEAPVVTAGATRVAVDENAADTAFATYMATDVDQTEALAWSLSGTDAGDFEISNEAGALGELTFKETPNYEMPLDSNRDNVYMVTVVATDAGVDNKNKMTAERAVVITVTNQEEDGTVTLTSLQPKVGFPLTASLTDLDGGEMGITWKWERDNSGTAEADGATTDCSSLSPTDDWEDVEGMGAKAATYTPEDEDEGKCLQATAMYTDGKGNGSDETMGVSDNAVIEDQANKAPEFDDDLSYTREIAENVTPTADNPANVKDPVTADDSPVTADDPNDDNLTYSLSGNDAGSFMIGSSDGQISAKMELDHEAKSSHTVTVTATDPEGATDSVDVTIKVTNVEEAPEIAGDDITKDYRENGRAQVAKFTGSDPEDRTVYWSLAADANADGVADADIADRLHFMINSEGVLSFKFPPDYDMPMDVGTDNTYKVVVEASDDAPGAEAIMMGYKKVTVMVTDVQETETITLSVQQAQVTVALTATYNDLDNERPDDTNLVWKWSLSGAPISRADATDTGLTSTYTPENRGSLRVEASYTRTDGTAKTVSKTVNVRAVPDAANAAPVFPAGSDARSVDENSPPGTNVGKPVTANDATGDKLTYVLTDPTNPDLFVIDPATGQITVAPRATLDREANGGNEPVTVMVTATDPAGAGPEPSGATTQDVTITINDVNEAPVVATGPTRVAVDENAVITTVVSTYTATDVDQDGNPAWSLSGTDAGDFEISNEADALGELTFKETPNYEMPLDSNRDNVYMVTVVATDAGVDNKNKMTAERAVVITVTNQEEDGTVTLTSVQPKIGFPLTASVTDLDGGEMGITWKWERDPTGTAEADGATTDCSSLSPTDDWEDVEGMGAKTATYTPEDEDVGKCLRATAMYTDGKGSAVAMGVSVNAVIEDFANKAPEFDDDLSYTREIAENVELDTTGDPNPANVKDPVTATDSPVTATDPNDDTLTYSLSGNDAGSFMIGSSDGQISAKMKLDHEAKSSHTVTVTATDPDGASDSVDVTITVTDVDEAPEIMLGGLTISGPSMASYPENGMYAVETYMASGSLAGRARWSLTGEDATDFRIATDGMLRFRSSPNYEMPRDADTDNIYKVTVKANASTYMDTHDVTVTVTNVEELGILYGNSRPSYMENSEEAVETYMPSGPDMATWSLEGTDRRYFTITDGMLEFKNSPNYEMPRRQALSDTNTNEYMVTVKAKAGGEMDEIMVTVTVANVEELGMLSGDSSRSYMENSDDAVATYTADGSMADMATWSLSGTDRRDFTITGGILNFRSAPDFEMPIGGSGNDSNIYMVTVKAEAGGEMEMLEVTVTVTNEDEDGMVTLIPMRPSIGTKITATLTDPDMMVTGTTWQWSRSTTMDGTFTPITGATSAMYTPVVDDDGYYLKATAMYTEGEVSGKVAEEMTESRVTLFAIDGPASRSYMENGTDAVATYTASGDAATTWTLAGDDAADFTITGGMLRFMSSPNYEMPMDEGMDNVYMVTVKGSDGTNEDTEPVTVTVTNVDEAGTVALTPMAISVDTEITATLTDPDMMVTGTTWQWSRSTTMAGPFTDIDTATSMTYTPVADDEGHHLTATASYTDGHGSGKSASGMTAMTSNMVVAGDPLLIRYDDNDSGKIERDEVYAAIDDYFNNLINPASGGLTKEQVYKIIDLYFGTLLGS